MTKYEERCREELRQLLERPGARYFLWRVLCECGVFQSTSAYDQHNMAIRSGRRDIGLWLLDEMFRADNKAFAMMQNEAQDREKEINGRDNSSERTD